MMKTVWRRSKKKNQSQQKREGIPEEVVVEEVGLSFNALNGENQEQTIKIQGEVGKKTLRILVDTGSTHSFLDFQVAKEVKAKVESTTPLTVTVANEHKIMSKLRSPGFTWTTQGQQYTADLRIIRLEGSSMVLGIDWLKKYGKVTFDYANNTVTLDNQGQQLLLKGVSEDSRLRMLTAKEWHQECQEGTYCVIAHITQLSEVTELTVPQELQELLRLYIKRGSLLWPRVDFAATPPSQFCPLPSLAPSGIMCLPPRLFPLGLKTMLAIVCKTYEGVKALEKHDNEGMIDTNAGLYRLGPPIGRLLNGRFLVLCLEKLRPFTLQRYKVATLELDFVQNRLFVKWVPFGNAKDVRNPKSALELDLREQNGGNLHLADSALGDRSLV
uniref:Uncharacterized protein n=1 Tax=Ananas comosus var. bracteatus TaxID=296719 RepID=A0A6V7QKL0_ANACO|nr:unnamed protein product [Ananas comosus var. bracteatus]